MTQTFDQLGVRAELSQTAAELGVTGATSLQASAIPVLRRGGNLVLHASTGSGLTYAYALPLLDRVSQTEHDDECPRILILVPTEDRASRKASDLTRLAAAVGLRAAALAAGWHRRGDASVVVATPGSARTAVERSALKLDEIAAFVLIDANSQISECGEDIAALMTSIPREAQRVIAATELTPEVLRFVDAHVRKALHVPARSDEPIPAPEIAGTLEYILVPESRKEATLVRLLEQRIDSRPVVVARGAASAAALRESLQLRGFNVSTTEGEDVRVVTPAEAAGAGNEISYDVPFETETLDRVHGSGGLVLATPPELPHLRRMAAAVGLALKAERVQSSASDALSEFRKMVRQAVHEEDVESQLAVLDPLFDEFSPAEVAAALSALVRKRTPAKAAASATQPAQNAGAPRPASAEAGFVRLFVSVGLRDNIRPGDLVGAMTGEAGITGDQVGKIDIRDTFTVVELATNAADRVIRALNGTTMKGRSLRVDYDRKGSGSPRDGRERGGRDSVRGSARDSPRGGPRDMRDGPRGERGGPRDGGARGGFRGGAPRSDRPTSDRPRSDRPRSDGPRGRGDSPPRRERPRPFDRD